MKSQEFNSFHKWLHHVKVEDLSEKLKISIQTVYAWRRGSQGPNVKHMKTIKRLTKGFMTYEMMIDGTDAI